MDITRRRFGVSVAAILPLLAGREMRGQESSEPQLEHVAGGYHFTEGPVWSREGYLLFSDVPDNKIIKLEPGQKPAVFRDDTNGTNGNTFDSQGRLYSCESRTRRVVRIDKKGVTQVLAERWEGRRLNAPNDIVVRKDGHIYFTDPAFGNQADTRELDFYGVSHITPKGQLNLIAKPSGRPRGIALSANRHLLCVANSHDPNVRAYNLQRNGDVPQQRAA